jgi:hypothetical protein
VEIRNIERRTHMLPFLLVGGAVMGSLAMVDLALGSVSAIELLGQFMKNKKLEVAVELGFEEGDNPEFLSMSQKDLPPQLGHLSGTWCLTADEKTHLQSMILLERITNIKGDYRGLKRKSHRRMADPAIQAQKPKGF